MGKGCPYISTGTRPHPRLDSLTSPPGLAHISAGARLSQVDKMKKLADGGKLTEKQEKVRPCPKGCPWGRPAEAGRRAKWLK